ncbi:MAG: signal transduction histidine kinase/DNA-binding NarL/FixJ family response regulator [Nonlabens sp.]|jgi:signal transduction histidine kinase/DNA-binding NarL/FixJ family response regulator
MKSNKDLRSFHFKYLAMFIHLSLFIYPMTSNGQSQTYQLTNRTDSIVRLFSMDLAVPELVKVLETLENQESVERIQDLKNQLDQVKGDERLEMKLNERLGRASKWADNIKDAYQYYTRALYLAEKLQENRTIAIACLEIANNIRLGNLIDRPYESYFERAIGIFETLNDPLSKSYLLYAKLLLQQDEKLKLEYAEKAIALLKSDLNRSDTLVMESLARHLNVAGLFQEDEQRIQLLQEGLAVAKEIGISSLQGLILNNIGYEFLVKQEYDKAIPYHLEALDISIQAGIKGLATNAFNNLSVCYRNKGMFKEALEYYHCFFYIQADISSDKYFQDLAEVEVKFEVDRVELKNDLLITEQILQGRQRLVLIIVTFLLLLIVLFVFWSRSKINKANVKLQALDKVKSRFFSNISHELRTPLALINAPLESLLHNEQIDDPVVRATLETASRNGVSLLSLVEEILDLAKLDGGKLELLENPVWLTDSLQLIISEYQLGFDTKKIKFKYDFQLDERLTLLFDENKFSKIIKNLLSNALKFTPEGGQIVLRAKQGDRGYIQIQVEDTGRGIHANDLPHVFERYYQSEQPGGKAEGGTGIGLALAKELAELQGGQLKVTSTLGQGSIFTFELPLKEVLEETVVQIASPKSVAVELALKETIAKYSAKFEVDKPVLLITEDHPEMRAFIAQTLDPYFEIKQAGNGKVALEILKSETIDIVISDVMMPEMDGFELLEEIKKDEKLHQVSVVMLTARADNEDKLFALTLGIDDYLTKPFSAPIFLARIKNILENRIKVTLEFRAISQVSEEGDNGLEKFIKEYKLNDRELDIMRLLAKRYNNQEIGEKLFLSTNTVKYHLKKLYSKLNLTSRQEMAREAERLMP